ncbi:TRAP transporter permease [Halomonas kalidii]|uniref:TRAP transporter fused permease subunit n=1 Tax=Halomonas kalidii TaxID=3043293 RepID=A0ABT6VPT0_9GAMM|nr:TRAP transporter fused permease subunit [Halomonas kalidii]MDI5934983.1 TRAP transporter fused permease subunit [Halomonas kalidii]
MSGHANFRSPLVMVATGLMYVVGALLVGGALYTAKFGVFDDALVRVGGFTLGALFLLFHSLRQPSHVLRWLLDLVLVILIGIAAWRYFIIADFLDSGLYLLQPLDLWCGLGGVLALLELTRRVIGFPLVLVSLLVASYAYFGDSLPGMLSHSGISYSELLQTFWYSFDGVFGQPLAVVTSTILVFIIFGAVLESLGIGQVLLNLSLRTLGRLRGGAAYAAVMASGLFGTVSGSVVANVVGTGVVTMPMIKRSGFSARFAGAVEAAASSGGQIMPPIMGAVAFIMADMTGIPYLKICLAALIPALLYYGSLFISIGAEAHRIGITAPDRRSLPTLNRQDWMLLLAFLVPLILIVVLMLQGRSPAMAGLWAIGAALILGLLFNPKARNIQALKNIVSGSASAGGTILIAVGAVGIIIAVMNLTGLGLRFASSIQSVADGSLFLSLVLMALACLVLGMGMPTVPAYLIIILIMGPAVEALGISTIAAHMFVVYFAVLSAITPPVALAAFAAAPIAGANPMSIGMTAMGRLALIGFLTPFVFVYSPSMLLITDFSFGELIWSLARLVMAAYLIAIISIRGRLWWGLSAAVSIALVVPSLPLQVFGAFMGGVALIAASRFKRPLTTSL